MAARQPQYSTKQIANALGSSESSVKRWCDNDVIPAVRTVGGHRRIALDGLRQFLDSTGRELVAPYVLGLPKLDIGRTVDIPGGIEPSRIAFRKAMADGDEDACREILQERLDAGWTRSRAADFLITDAMHGIGQAWDCKELDIYQERRGCDISIRLINELRRGLAPLRDDAPVAIGGSPEGDHYQLPSAMVDLTLRELGWNAVSLGHNLPWDSFIQASHDYQPSIMWLSVSHISDASSLVLHQNRLADNLGEDVSLLVGGRAINDAIRPRLQYTAFCESMQHLNELAAMMRIN